jgi:choline-glycine betaine transporter
MQFPTALKNIRHTVFWPIFGLFSITSIVALLNPENFLRLISGLNQQMLNQFGPIFSIAALAFLVMVIALYISPIGKTIIGGKTAKPLFSKPQWFYVTLCTTVATGILFWGAAEPLFHLHNLPQNEGLQAGTRPAAVFGLSTLFTHWSIIPYGIYTLLSVIFALLFYNLGNRYSLSSLFGKSRLTHKLSPLIDSLALFSLVAGMSASLGAGILLLNGGINRFVDFPNSPINLAVVCGLVVSAFIVSSVSGIQKGIKWLSDINAKLFFFLALFVLIFGSYSGLLSLSVDALTRFITHFFQQSLVGVLPNTDTVWAKDWTIFYWTNWLAWAPISALFLARIGVGYSVRTFIRFNLLYPSLFSILWMIIFGGNALITDLNGSDFPLNDVLTNEGNGQVVFALIKDYPLSTVMSLIFLIAVFISYVTAADSNTTAMSAISSTNIDKEHSEAHFSTKIAWGLLIGVVTWIMIAFSGDGASTGLDGIRILSNLGGLPALIIAIAAFVQAFRWILKGEIQA